MRKAVVEYRKVLRSGKSLYVSIPHKFAKFHGIEKGDELAVVTQRTMKVFPNKKIRVGNEGYRITTET